MSLNSGTQAANQEKAEQRYWDVEAQLASPTPTVAVTGALARVPDVAGVQACTRTPIGIAGPAGLPVTRTYPDQGHGGIAINTIPAGAKTFPPPKLLEGRWLRPGETGAVVLNQITRNNTLPDLGAGDRVQLFIGANPSTWRVVGIAEEREASGGGVYTTAEGLAAATGQPQGVNQLRIITDRGDESTRNAVAMAVDKALTGAGIKVASAASVSRSAAAAEGHTGPVLLVLIGIAVPLGVVGVIGLASTMSTNVLDRTREFGVMHAIGARPRAVRRIVTAEGVVLALTSCLVAVLPALGLTKILGDGLGNLFMNAPLPFRVSLPAAGIWIALVILGAALATDAAATRASRITIPEALSYL
jgi:putative ABC transport system permease protein